MAASAWDTSTSSSDRVSAAQASSMMSRLDGRVVAGWERRSFVAAMFLLSDVVLMFLILNGQWGGCWTEDRLCAKVAHVVRQPLPLRPL